MQRFSASDPFSAIISGVKNFQTDAYQKKRELFSDLAKGQQPGVLFITCSDSRIDPALITQTDPGSLFMVQNAGNIIPPHGTPYGGTGASIEYALSILNVQHVIVCGHSSCGAMGALLDDNLRKSVPPIIGQWISYADATRAIMDEESENLSSSERLHRCVKRNVQVQVRNLKTFPSVAARLATGKLTIHGWYYDVGTGGVDVYDPDSDAFIPFEQAYSIQEAGVTV